MGLSDSSSATVTAILTKKAREMIAKGGNLNITKFALSDEEIDYTMYDNTHPDGTNSHTLLLENTSLLEATPNRKKLDTYLIDNVVDENLVATDIVLPRLHYTQIYRDQHIGIHPQTINGTQEEMTEQYLFEIENTKVVRFKNLLKENGDLIKILNPNQDTIEGQRVTFVTQKINPGATTTIKVTGLVSKITKVISMKIRTLADVNVNPFRGTIDATNPKYY
jgi:hypothetical protein